MDIIGYGRYWRLGRRWRIFATVALLFDGVRPRLIVWRAVGIGALLASRRRHLGLNVPFDVCGNLVEQRIHIARAADLLLVEPGLRQLPALRAIVDIFVGVEVSA